MKVKVKQEMTSTFLFYYAINARIFPRDINKYIIRSI